MKAHEYKSRQWDCGGLGTMKPLTAFEDPGGHLGRAELRVSNIYREGCFSHTQKDTQPCSSAALLERTQALMLAVLGHLWDHGDRAHSPGYKDASSVKPEYITSAHVW